MIVGCPRFGSIESSWQLSSSSRAAQASKLTLMRYAWRMTSRPTPFGLFAAVSVGTIGGPETILEVSSGTADRVVIRPSLSELLVLSSQAVHDPEVIPRLLWEPSPGSYVVGNMIRFLGRQDQSQQARYVMMAVELTPQINAVIREARG
jgi:lantibiotic biosynthesis protein